MNYKLTPKQKLFADEYLIDLNATRAYKAAYKSCKKDETANVNGSKLLRNTKVAKYIEERMNERSRRTEITQDNVLKELATIAFAKVTDFVTIENGVVIVKDTKDISKKVKMVLRLVFIQKINRLNCLVDIWECSMTR